MAGGCGSPWVVVEGVWKRYGRTWALQGVSLTIDRPGVHVLYGHNGSGKSTLIRVISGLTRPTRGRVEVCGLDPGIFPGRVLSRIALGIEGSSFQPYLAGRELARSIAEERGAGLGGIEGAAGELGVTGYWDRPVFTYSMGMRKRLLLAIAVGLALDGYANVLVLDEPYTLLDPETRRRVAGLIMRVASEMPVLLATHIITEAEERGERLYLLSGGRIVGVYSRENSGIARCPLRDDLLDEIERVGYDRITIDRRRGIVIVEGEAARVEGCTRLLRPPAG